MGFEQVVNCPFLLHGLILSNYAFSLVDGKVLNVVFGLQSRNTEK